jgi:DNA polymerase
VIHIDFETRSEAPLTGTKKVSSWIYSKHPSTEIVCLAWDCEGSTGLWYPEKFDIFCDPLSELYELVASGAHQIGAFNVSFERSIWENILMPQFDAPKIHGALWYCVASASYACSLPGSMSDVAKALGLSEEKDDKGHKLMLKMCKPRRPSKNNPAKWHETEDDLLRLGEYCGQDVQVEKAIYHAVPRLSELENEVYQCDQKMNLRGFNVDVETIAGGIEILEQTQTEANEKLSKLTHGCVNSLSQTAVLRQWLADTGLDIPDLQADTIDDFLDSPLVENAMHRKALELRKEFARSSTSKYGSMLRNADTDSRVRQTLRYCGAGRTRRWSGQIVQTQNLKRGVEDSFEMDFIAELIRDKDIEGLRSFYGSVPNGLSRALRGMICAKPGHSLYVCDFSAIEARVTAWVTGNLELLTDFRWGKDPYISFATAIYDKPYEDVTKEERFFGKQAILGLGYGMGHVRFRQQCADYGKEITQEFAEEIVYLYRDKYPMVKNFWRTIESDAIRCVATKQPVKSRYYSFRMETIGIKRALVITLPNGSERWYVGAHVRDKTKFEKEIPTVHYWGQNQKTRKWEVQDTYGGKLTENLVQSIARELQCYAVLACENAGFNPVLQVHDEIICELPGEPCETTLKRIERTMGENPPWCRELPLEALGWTGERYRKD